MILPRHCVMVPLALQAGCNHVAHQIGIDPENQGTLTIALVPVDGPDDAEPTHYGACGGMNEPHRLALIDWLAANPGPASAVRWWRWTNHGDDLGKLEASWDGQDLGEPWGWPEALAAAGLQVRVVPYLNPTPAEVNL